MHLQKTGADNIGTKKISGQSVKNILSKPQAQAKNSVPVQPAKNVSAKTPVQAAKLPASSLSSVTRTSSSLAAAAGLPNDKLSAAIVTFARFFSLPLNPQVLAAIRRQVFSPQTPQSLSHNSTEAKETSGSLAAKAREALSLAAAAAESKGIELNAKGLEAYAKAVDPEWQRRRDTGERRQKRQNENDNERTDEKTPRNAASINAPALEKTALEFSANDPLLAILNRLPAKHGRRWIVLPFDFLNEKYEYRVSMRILQEDESGRSSCMALDIAEYAGGKDGGESRRWIFILESANNRMMKLTACFPPEFSSAVQSKLKYELSDLLHIPLECVFIKSYVESFPFESEKGEEFSSIDEAV